MRNFYAQHFKPHMYCVFIFDNSIGQKKLLQTGLHFDPQMEHYIHKKRRSTQIHVREALYLAQFTQTFQNYHSYFVYSIKVFATPLFTNNVLFLSILNIFFLHPHLSKSRRCHVILLQSKQRDVNFKSDYSNL